MALWALAVGAVAAAADGSSGRDDDQHHDHRGVAAR